MVSARAPLHRRRIAVRASTTTSIPTTQQMDDSETSPNKSCEPNEPGYVATLADGRIVENSVSEPSSQVVPDSSASRSPAGRRNSAFKFLPLARGTFLTTACSHPERFREFSKVLDIPGGLWLCRVRRPACRSRGCSPAGRACSAPTRGA